MIVTIFQSDNGDCLLLRGADGKTILVDGGLSGSYKKHVSPALVEYSKRKAIDLVYVSHIDRDHIGGILQLFDDMAAWRVYDYQMSTGNSRFPVPRTPRPPNVKAVWHNTFKDLVEDNEGELEAMMVANSRLANMDARVIGEGLADQAEGASDLVTSVKEGLLLSRRLSPTQLNIAVNSEYDGRLIFVRESSPPVHLGGMEIRVIGPFQEDLEKLRREWNKWLKDNQEAVERIRRESHLEVEAIPMLEGQALLSYLHTLAAEIGNRNLVTTPNLASLMLLIEENGRSVLLTGDGHARDILRGLDQQGKLDTDGRMHANVLKIQHHGSKNNIDETFCKAVTADHYIFCGNGGHGNPDLEVLNILLESRLGSQAGSVGSEMPFTLWFSSSEKMAGTPARQEHMRQVEVAIRRAARASKGKLRYRFLTRGSRLNLSV